MSDILIESKIILNKDRILLGINLMILILENSLNFKIDLMNTLKFKQDFNNLTKVMIVFIENNYKNVYFEIKNNLNYLTTLKKFNQLEEIYRELLKEKKLSLFFEPINKYLILNIHKNKDFSYEIIKSLINEGFDIPVNVWIEYMNLIFDSPEKNLIFDFIKIISIKVSI